VARKYCEIVKGFLNKQLWKCTVNFKDKALNHLQKCYSVTVLVVTKYHRLENTLYFSSWQSTSYPGSFHYAPPKKPGYEVAGQRNPKIKISCVSQIYIYIYTVKTDWLK
jgi:hypothetical protein